MLEAPKAWASTAAAAVDLYSASRLRCSADNAHEEQRPSRLPLVIWPSHRSLSRGGHPKPAGTPYGCVPCASKPPALATIRNAGEAAESGRSELQPWNHSRPRSRRRRRRRARARRAGRAAPSLGGASAPCEARASAGWERSGRAEAHRKSMCMWLDSKLRRPPCWRAIASIAREPSRDVRSRSTALPL